jgi:hypothetical protein
MAVLAEDQASAQDIPLSATALESLRQVIQTVLLSEDWDTLQWQRQALFKSTVELDLYYHRAPC